MGVLEDPPDQAYLITFEGFPKSALSNLLDVGQTGKLPYQRFHAGQFCHLHLPEMHTTQQLVSLFKHAVC